MKFVLKQMNDEMDKLSRREQVLITLATLTIITGLWKWGFYKPMSHWYKTSAKQVTLLKTEIKDQNKASKIFKLTGKEASEYQTLVKLQSIEKKLAALEDRPVINKNKTLSPEEIPEALARLATLNPDIQLQRLETLSDIKTPDHSDELDELSYMFQQNVVVEFSGQQHDFIEFVKTLESLPWSIQKLNYEKKPGNEILNLHIFTLGFHKDWFNNEDENQSLSARK
ncbi:MAG: hypothetical protein V3U75_06530 [Methylococcaceae bacterium]